MGIRNVGLARNLGLAVLLSVSMLWAQQTPGQGNTPTSPSQPSPGREPQQPGRQPGQQQRPEFPGQDPFGRDPSFGRSGQGISGRIVNAPSINFRMELYRNGMLMDSTFIQTDGGFHFERAQPNNRYEIRLDMGNGWEYREEVHFYNNFPATIIIREHGIRRNTFAKGEAVGSGTIISVASLKVPKKAKKEFKKARKAARKKKYGEALGRLQKATEIYPQYAEAFNEMGMIYLGQKQREEARQAFEQAIAADPKWVDSYVNLASLQLSSNQPRQLLETSNKILQLYPTLGPGHFFHSVANLSMGRLEEAEKSALRADSREHRRVPQIHLVLARIYRHRGEWTEAEKQLRTFLKERPKASNADGIKAQIKKLHQQAKAQGEQAKK